MHLGTDFIDLNFNVFLCGATYACALRKQQKRSLQGSASTRSEQNSDRPTSLKHTQATKWLLTFKREKNTKLTKTLSLLRKSHLVVIAFLFLSKVLQGHPPLGSNIHYTILSILTITSVHWFVEY